MFIFDRFHCNYVAVTPVKYERDIQYITIVFIILKNWENRETEEFFFNRNPHLWAVTASEMLTGCF